MGSSYIAQTDLEHMTQLFHLLTFVRLQVCTSYDVLIHTFYMSFPSQYIALSPEKLLYDFMQISI